MGEAVLITARRRGPNRTTEPAIAPQETNMSNGRSLRKLLERFIRDDVEYHGAFKCILWHAVTVTHLR
jgi:hypothetical protein